LIFVLVWQALARPPYTAIVAHLRSSDIRVTSRVYPAV
jgi:hypothetical protein